MTEERYRGKTDEQLRDRLFEIECHREAARSTPGVYVPVREFQEHRDLTAELERRQAAAVDQERAEEIGQQREAVAAVLIGPPGTVIRRTFIRDSVEQLIDRIVANRVTARRDCRRPAANILSRTVYGDRALTESALAEWGHELGHILSADADSWQWRHTFIQDTVVSPRAECAAWSWCFDNCYRRIWTTEMQERMTQALNTYRLDATRDERDLITATIADGFKRLRPAPDTFEGREERLDQIRREDRVREIERERRPARLAYEALAARIRQGAR
jgi:hypothetical protein